MKLKEIEKELDVMESSFKEIVHLAYDNAPDCDEAAMEEFNETMTSEEKAFEQSITALRAFTERTLLYQEKTTRQRSVRHAE